jgi:hypothetical protein
MNVKEIVVIIQFLVWIPMLLSTYFVSKGNWFGSSIC